MDRVLAAAPAIAAGRQRLRIGAYSNAGDARVVFTALMVAAIGPFRGATKTWLVLGMGLLPLAHRS